MLNNSHDEQEILDHLLKLSYTKLQQHYYGLNGPPCESSLRKRLFIRNFIRRLEHERTNNFFNLTTGDYDKTTLIGDQQDMEPITSRTVKLSSNNKNDEHSNWISQQSWLKWTVSSSTENMYNQVKILDEQPRQEKDDVENNDKNIVQKTLLHVLTRLCET
ncbi:unnamed protein product [Didymodactylos carnosus]|uniref:Uncharacterized protein n=1 Tax=Didymodactylos carnosus TaxID=1234261 RepID=A0A814YPM6_9BILA|nr:unnamed protein product [Didymodactylos carnosus]CAF1233825.1 unnamed protein product [Didymodactylos carnosus]CAF3589678.1 unnamed protein product [Didymodactylos carnosus]CAF3996374.1 unnamed protein product [Didymodactylos carnosus]